MAAESDDVDAALQFIEETNLLIDEKVEQAVKNAAQLRSQYLEDIQKAEEKIALVSLIEEQTRLTLELKQVQDDELKVEALKAELVEVEKKIQEEKEEINRNLAIIEEILVVTGAKLSDEVDNVEELDKQLAALVSELGENYDIHLPRTKQYQQDLDTLITDIFNETLYLSKTAIDAAAEVGIVAECSWVYVQFADRWAWIDPVRVVKM